MSVQTEIDRISGNVSAALAAIAEKGVTVPDGSTSDALADLIAAIEAGGGLPDGLSKIAIGSWTGADANTTIVTIEHGLGVIPDFAVLYCPIPNTSSSYHTIFTAISNKTSDTSIRTSVVGYNSTSNLGGAKTSSEISDGTYFTSTSFTFKNIGYMYGSSSKTAYFPTSRECKWIAGVFA